MSRTSTTAYEARFVVGAPQSLGRDIVRQLAGLVSGLRACGLWHDAAAARRRPLAAGSGGIVQAIIHRSRVRRATRELVLLSDHMLRDIGITRAEIVGALGQDRN